LLSLVVVAAAVTEEAQVGLVDIERVLDYLLQQELITP
jgi:hypothetical protein